MRAVIVGASLAGIRTAEALRRQGHDDEIVVVGAEPHLPYDRPPLSKQLLAGTMEAAEVELRFDPDVDVEFRLSTRARALDLQRRRVLLAPGGELPFDGLVIATGAHPRMLPGLADLDGVHLLRTVDDSLALRQALLQRPRVAVVGAGFIGSEVAATCHGLGLEVAVIEALPVPLAGALGQEVGRRCARLHLDHGVDLRLGVGVTGLAGTSRVEGVVLGDGTVVPADLVVVGVGVAPATEWLAGSGVDIDNGVRCDRWCRVLAGGVPLDGVTAAGDVASRDSVSLARPVRVEHWTNAVEQSETAAAALVRGIATAPFDPVPYFWSDQYDTKIQFVGQIDGHDRMQVLDGSLEDDRFVVGWTRHGRLVAALGFGRPAQIMRCRALIASGSVWPPQTAEVAQ
jgi:NADPH-dependent 2,4-dienoyl-CoA reductase/sulfur reductase-like enzyme